MSELRPAVTAAGAHADEKISSGAEVLSPAAPLPAEFVLTEVMRADDEMTDVFRRLAERLQHRGGTLLGLLVYGSVSEHASAQAAMQDTLGLIEWPVTWVEGASCTGRPLSGVQAFATSGVAVNRLILGGRVLASIYDDGHARHAYLGGIVPTATSMERPAQVQQMFATLDTALDLAGFEVADVARTWFFNDDILAWYGAFNRVRTAFYEPVRFRVGATPASTGVAARNPAGAAAALAAWAVRPYTAGARAEAVASPLQCPAPAYGSSFSRAVEIVSAGQRRLMISGTASIAPEGQTMWQGDVAKQIELTMQVLAALLESRGMAWGDTTRATAYFKDPASLAVFRAWQERHPAAAALPFVPVHCDICRDDLLFELELDACRAD